MQIDLHIVQGKQVNVKTGEGGGGGSSHLKKTEQQAIITPIRALYRQFRTTSDTRSSPCDVEGSTVRETAQVMKQR
jgi:hypothetical protein